VSKLSDTLSEAAALSVAPRKIIVLSLLAILLLVIVIIWKGGEALKNRQIEELQLTSEEQLAQLASVIESAIVKYQHMPTLLATNGRVKKALRDGFYQDISHLNLELEQINRITEASDSYILNKDGLTIAASNYQSDASFIGNNFAFRPYFQQAIQGKPGRYYALGTMSNRRGYYFSYPVVDDEKIIGVAVVKVDISQFEKRFANQNYDFVLLDPDGVVFSSSRPSWLYQVLRGLSYSELKRIAESKRYKDRPIEKLPIAYQKPLSDTATLVDVLETNPLNGELERRSYLKMSRPIQLLGFTISILSPLQLINEEIALWRAIFAGGLTITGLLAGLALLRRRMLLERYNANEMTRHNQAYIREVIQNTQAGLVTLDDKHCIESFNPAIEQLVGQPLSVLIGQPLQNVFHAEDQQKFANIWRADDKLGIKVVTMEGYLQLDKVDSVPVEMTLCEMKLPNRRSYLVTFHDMTERKRYEQEVMQAQLELEKRVRERTFELEEANLLLRQEMAGHKDTQRELIQTAKLAVLGQLSAGLNHELNQPLTAIRAFAGNGLKFLDRQNYQQAHNNLEQINQLGQHMSDIISRFKVFARKGDVQQGPIAVQTAIIGAIKIISPRYKEVGIELQVPEDQGFIVHGDMVFLEQVLVNLLANAADAIQEAKKHSDDRLQRVCIEQTANQDDVTICVRDSGDGLTEDAIKHLFEPFFTSKSSGVGLGLGLSISQRIVEVMGGQIKAHNCPEGGAEFVVVLSRFQSKKISEREPHDG